MHKNTHNPAEHTREEINGATSDNWEVTRSIIDSHTGAVHTSNGETTIRAERKDGGWMIRLEKSDPKKTQLLAARLTREEAVERITEFAYALDF